MIRNLTRVGWKKQRVGRFAVVGILNTIVDFMVFIALYYSFGVPALWANTTSYSAGILNSFLFNKHWTFSDSSPSNQTLRQFVLFVLLNFVGLTLSNLVVTTLTNLMPAVVAKLIAIFVTFTWSYWSSHRIVFAPRSS